MTTIRHYTYEPIHRPARTDLGRLVGRVEAEARDLDATFADPIMIQSGCADEFGPGIYRKARERVHAVLAEAGYASYRAFMEEVEARTSARWVYIATSLGMWADIPGHDGFFDEEPEPTDAALENAWYGR